MDKIHPRKYAKKLNSNNIIAVNIFKFFEINYLSLYFSFIRENNIIHLREWGTLTA